MIKKSILLCLMAVAALTMGAVVKPGIEVLRDNGFKQLQGKRVGLVTNPSGIDNNLKSTVDILNEAPGVKLVALYGPEHGVRGNAHAGDAVGDEVDPKTGVKMYSLYGKTHKPTAEMLKDIDVLVYDIQDIGCRSYTFYATMGVCMEACAEQGKEFMVLDRPNPLGGNKVEGNLVEDGYYSFVSKYAIPYLYGLTPGELATFLNEEGGFIKGHAKLTVIPMEGWTRDMKFRDTGMPWVLPSPQIPTPECAFYYPLSGIIGELYIFNTGIGYTLPFQLFCATWADADRVADAMNALQLPGLQFRPINVKPFFVTSVDVNQEKKEVHGVQTYITDVDAANLTLTQFYFLQVMHELYPDVQIFEQNPKRYAMFDKVCGTKEIRERFTRRYKVEDIIQYWTKDAEAFRLRSAKYYLYK
ncbi:MAG: DUF1343 domain-containing protein [Muribaculaceae bacterium]|nr:DUF1343 domain-containing protein [Muribaculaceae bacterium]